MSGEAGRLVVTDVRGRVVRTVAVQARVQSVTVDLAVGVYSVRAEAGGVVATARVTVAR